MESLENTMKKMESGFNHDAKCFYEACKTTKEKVKEMGEEAFKNTKNSATVSALIEGVLDSDGTDAEKLLTCFSLGGYLEKSGMRGEQA